MLFGRDAECAAISRLLDGARVGRGGALVLRGVPGAGKTALLDYAARADGFRVLAAVGVPAEADLPYAAAHQLLRPVLGQIDAIPAPQAGAVRAALGMAEGAPDRFLVALGILSLLTDVSHPQPLLCAIDDVQWCDRASLDALAFVIRRVNADNIAFVFTQREAEAAPSDLAATPVLRVEPLEEDAARQLLAEAKNCRPASDVARSLTRRTGGNPLALVEFARSLTTAQLEGAAPLPDSAPMADGVEASYLRRVQELNGPAQQLLLVAAVEESGHVPTVRAAVAGLGGDQQGWDEAAGSELITIDADAMRFAHPLVRSAIYSAATTAQRRAVRDALAAAYDSFGDTDRATWQRVAEREEPDAALSRQLEQLGDRGRLRSAQAAASTAYERAAELAPGEADTFRLQVEAADAAWSAGDLARCGFLLDQVEPRALLAGQRAAVLRLRGRVAAGVGGVDEAYRYFMDAAALLAATEPSAALEMLADAEEAAVYRGNLEWRMEAAAAAADIDPGTDRRGRFLFAWLTVGRAINEPGSPDHVASLRQSLALAETLDDPRLLVRAGIAAVQLGDLTASRRTMGDAARLARATGSVAVLPYLLEHVGTTEVLAGIRFPAVRAAGEEGLRLALETGQRSSACVHRAILALVAAICDECTAAQALVTEAREEADRLQLGLAVLIVTWAQSRLSLASGDALTAYTVLTELMNRPASGRIPSGGQYIVIDLVEAASRCGRQGDMEPVLGRLESLAASNGQPRTAATLVRCQGLLGTDDQGIGMLIEAADMYREIGAPYDEARTRLVAGERLRRNRHRSAGREQLRIALDIFDDLGTHPWAERAAAELAATGGVITRGATPALALLTPQELQVVRRVCQGESNREVATHLFISPRTVEYHLYKAYPKLGVTSRIQVLRDFADHFLLGAG
jgi:DNA-binding CsgD family transcriptional regulator